ncbi:MAG TPA: DUF308 domain-containing protein [Micromonospora sp.]
MRPIGGTRIARGVFAIAFGVLAIFWPRLTVYAIALLFGAFAAVTSLLLLIETVWRDGEFGDRIRHKAPRVIGASVGLVAGLATLLWPEITLWVLVMLAGAWAVATGLADLWSASQQGGHWLLAITGAVSIAAGVLVIVLPTAGALAIARVLGAVGLVSGALMLTDGVRQRRAVPDQTAATPRSS